MHPWQKRAEVAQAKAAWLILKRAGALAPPVQNPLGNYWARPQLMSLVPKHPPVQTLALPPRPMGSRPTSTKQRAWPTAAQPPTPRPDLKPPPPARPDLKPPPPAKVPASFRPVSKTYWVAKCRAAETKPRPWFPATRNKARPPAPSGSNESGPKQAKATSSECGSSECQSWQCANQHQHQEQCANKHQHEDADSVETSTSTIATTEKKACRAARREGR